MKTRIETVTKVINEFLNKNERILITVDGRSAAGKTTFAEEFSKICDCNVIHGDDFFLRPEQRTAERFSQTGENIDYERLIEEVIIPVKNGEAFSYRPFDCHTMSLKDTVYCPAKKINIIEGAYCCNRYLYEYADLHIFADIDTETQKQRIIARNRENADMFFTRWIPMEERYFEEYNIKEICEIKI